MVGDDSANNARDRQCRCADHGCSFATHGVRPSVFVQRPKREWIGTSRIAHLISCRYRHLLERIVSFVALVSGRYKLKLLLSLWFQLTI